MIEMPVGDEQFFQSHACFGNTLFQLVEITTRINQRTLHRLGAPNQRAILLQWRNRNDRGFHRRSAWSGIGGVGHVQAIGRLTGVLQGARVMEGMEMTRKDIAFAFFDACESGKGWEECEPYCTKDAGFSAQAASLGEVTTLATYADWMKGNFQPLPDAKYEILSFGIDEERGTACVAAVLKATHSGEGGPIPPTGKSTATHYCYVMEFSGDKISHMTKIWNDGFAFSQLGWA